MVLHSRYRHARVEELFGVSHDPSANTTNAERSSIYIARFGRASSSRAMATVPEAGSFTPEGDWLIRSWAAGTASSSSQQRQQAHRCQRIGYRVTNAISQSPPGSAHVQPQVRSALDICHYGCFNDRWHEPCRRFRSGSRRTSHYFSAANAKRVQVTGTVIRPNWSTALRSPERYRKFSPSAPGSTTFDSSYRRPNGSRNALSRVAV